MTFGYWLITLGLVLILLSSIRTGMQIMREGNRADPLRREIEEENRRRIAEGSSEDEDKPQAA